MTLDINKVKGNEPSAGTQLELPGRTPNGDFIYTNPDNKDDHVTAHKDGTLDGRNSVDGTSYHQEYLDSSGSYVRDHHGPKDSDNFKQTFNFKENYTFTEVTDKNGTTIGVGSDGTTRVKDKVGNWKAEYPPTSPRKDASYDKMSDVTTVHNRDGSTLTNYGSDKLTVVVDTDGTKTVTQENGTQTVEKKTPRATKLLLAKFQAKTVATPRMGADQNRRTISMKLMTQKLEKQ